jgi:CBS domain-containing protein
MSIGRFMDQVAWSRRYTTYPVVENGHLVGLLAFRGVASVPRTEWDAQLVGQSMIARDRVPTLRADESAIDAFTELSQGDVNRGFVLDGDHLVGFLSITDLARALEVGGRQAPNGRSSARVASRRG